ncbi:MAG: FAD:protein FMN transferase [Chlamydiia bacterium]|nr:FAD:protein FMN transferase [Chlamydiia bacterium]
MPKYLLALLILLLGCQKGPTHFHGVAHTHPYRIQIGKTLSKKESIAIEQLIAALFEEVGEHYNHWNPESTLSKDPHHPRLTPLLSLARHFQSLTKGRYHPQLKGPLHLLKTTGTLPSQNHPPLYDLDGMLKGYLLDRLSEALLAKGYSDFYLEWGGEILVSGKHPSGRRWRVLIFDTPTEVENCALATSGCSEQLFRIEGKLYTHIMDPHSQKIVEVAPGKVHTVTVRASSGALADALATACMTCSSSEEALSFANEMKAVCGADFYFKTIEE